MLAQTHNVRALLDAGTITAVCGGAAAVVTALARLLRVLRERRACPCACEHCNPDRLEG